MRTNIVSRLGWIAAVACIAAEVHALETHAKEPRNRGGLTRAATAANSAADARFENYAAFWRQTISDLGSKTRFRNMAKEVASFDEKLAQGADLFNSDSTPPKDRTRISFRRHIVNEHALAQSMFDSLVKFQQELIGESVALYVKAGVDRKVAEEFFQPQGIDGTPWLDAFDPLIAKAKALAREDWWRVGAITVGSGVVIDQAMKNQEPTWESFFTGLIAQAVAETALEYATDPTDRFAEKLMAEFSKAEASLLTSKNGLLTTMRQLTDYHKQIRSRHFSIGNKGVK